MLECEEDSQKSLNRCECLVQEGEETCDCCKVGVELYGGRIEQGDPISIIYYGPVGTPTRRSGRQTGAEQEHPLFVGKFFFFRSLVECRVVSSKVRTVSAPLPPFNPENFRRYLGMVGG
jgi:hypothetical protein